MNKSHVQNVFSCTCANSLLVIIHFSETIIIIITIMYIMYGDSRVMYACNSHVYIYIYIYIYMYMYVVTNDYY